MRTRHLARAIAVVAGLGLVAVPAVPASAAVVVPSYVRTIGGGTAGHADMYPSGVSVDGVGNVYVADTGDDLVTSYAPDGTMRWSEGSRGAKAPGRFDNPRDVAFLNGKVYVADTGYNRVQVLNASDGSVSSVWPTRFGTIMGIGAGVDGTGGDVVLVAESSASTIRVYTPGGTLVRSVGTGPGNGAGELNQARDAATDAAGHIFVADYKNSRVAEFGPNGGWIAAWGVNGTGPSQLKRPYGIDLDDAGNVYVADSNDYIHEYTQTGTFIRAYGSPGDGPGLFSMLRRVAVGSGATPKVYGADLWTYKVEIFSAAGTNLGMVGGTPPADGYFNQPYGVAVDDQDTFVVDMVNQRVQRFSTVSPFGFELKWGARGWGEGNPGFNWPKGVAISSNGGSRSIWVADTRNSRLTEFWPNGTPTGRKFGTSGAGVGQLRWPFDVSSQGASRLVVADTNNNRVQLWDPAGPSVVWTSTGPSVPFSKPKGVDVDSGKVYVADTQNHRVVVLDATDGSVLDTFGADVLKSADGVVVEPDGEVWVSDSRANRLVQFSPTGAFLQNFGSVGSGNNQFNKPYHLAIHTDGTGAVQLYVVDSWNDRIQVYDVD
jgi:hypothetical protein